VAGAALGDWWCSISPASQASEPGGVAKTLEAAMRVRTFTLAGCIALGSIGYASVLSSELAPLKVRVTVVAPDGAMNDTREELKAGQLIGEYYVGDGLGYNLYLVLKDGGKFECTWRGCLGAYGTASGKWVIRESGLTITTQKADGILQDRQLDRLRIFSFQKNYLLLQERDLDWFKKHGPDTHCCFHQRGARKAPEQLSRLRVEQAVKILEEKRKK
jgi:hypothetical protein